MFGMLTTIAQIVKQYVVTRATVAINGGHADSFRIKFIVCVNILINLLLYYYVSD